MWGVGRGVGANCVLCRTCGKGCHMRCSGLRSLSAAAVAHCGGKSVLLSRGKNSKGRQSWGSMEKVDGNIKPSGKRRSREVSGAFHSPSVERYKRLA